MLVNMKKKTLSRSKAVLVEQVRTNKWLAEKLNKHETTISKWCTNEVQPLLEKLVDVAFV